MPLLVWFFDAFVGFEVAFEFAGAGAGFAGDFFGAAFAGEVKFGVGVGGGAAVFDVEGLGFEAYDVGLDVGDVGLLFFPGAEVLRLFVGACGAVGAVVARVAFEGVGCGIECEGAGCCAVEEFAVVRDDEGCAAVGLDEVFEPVEGGNVEVVGGFVEEEEVGCAEEEECESKAGFLPAAEGAEGCIAVDRAEAESLEDGVGALGVGVAAECFEACECCVVGGECVGGVVGGGEVFGGLLECGFGGEDVGLGGGKEVGDGLFEVGAEGLREVADREGGGGAGDGAAVGGFGSDDAAQEGGFAGAVSADQAKVFAVVDDEGDVFEDGGCAVVFA